jgi:hypothetical protein
MKKLLDRWREEIKKIKKLFKKAFITPKQKRFSYIILRQILIYFFIAIILFSFSVFKIILPAIEEVKQLNKNIENNTNLLYGKNLGDIGILDQEENLRRKYEKMKENYQKKEDEEQKKLNQVLFTDEDNYDLAIFFEDYEVTMKTEKNPIVFTNIVLGEEKEYFKTSIENLNNVSPYPLNEESLLNIFGPVSDWEPYLYDFLEKREDNNWYFKKAFVGENLKDFPAGGKRKQMIELWEKTPKVTIPAKYEVLKGVITIESTKKAFEDFLKFVYYSGNPYYYYFKGNPVPMMSIDVVNLPVNNKKDNLEDEEVKTESFTVNMSFYYYPSEKKEEEPNK